MRSCAQTVEQLREAGITEGHVLVVGLPDGALLARLRDAGYTPLGLDLSRAAVHDASQTIPTRIEVGDVCRPLPFAPESLDAVVLDGMVEQLAAPDVAVRNCCNALRSGGVLLARTLNAEGLPARLFGSRWSFYEAPENQRAYDLSELVALLGYNGLQVHRWWTGFDRGGIATLLRPAARLLEAIPSTRLGGTLMVAGRKPKAERKD